jgi:hypothetical protein
LKRCELDDKNEELFMDARLELSWRLGVLLWKLAAGKFNNTTKLNHVIYIFVGKDTKENFHLMSRIEFIRCLESQRFDRRITALIKKLTCPTAKAKSFVECKKIMLQNNELIKFLCTLVFTWPEIKLKNKTPDDFPLCRENYQRTLVSCPMKMRPSLGNNNKKIGLYKNCTNI